VTDPRLHIRSPEWLKDINAQMLSDPQLPAAVLTVAGRRTGALRRTPVTLYERDGARYVVGGFPGADWVRNVRAAGHAVLSVDGHDERVRLVELDAASAEPVLRHAGRCGDHARGGRHSRHHARCSRRCRWGLPGLSHRAGV
jgi:deazaflavin-dependent oxidoreductase (nitroreductase family)